VVSRDYQALAVRAIRGILEQEHAVVWNEVEARASERSWADLPSRIDPHHLTNARRAMTNEDELLSTAEPTKGGRIIEVHYLADAGKRTVQDAASRKRLLQARFLGWAKGTKRHPRGLVGGAGEAVTAASMRAAASVGYQLLPQKGGEVAEVFGKRVIGGPLDNGAHLIVMEGDLPTGVVTVLVEVKNVREWLYPIAVENYQLLYKAAQMQVDNPTRSIVPVLVCRRGHKTLFRMAKSFGFYVIDSHRQFLTPSADINDDHLREVQRELAYSDLVKTDSEDDLITKHFRSYLPREARAFAERWAATAPALVEEFRALRVPGHPGDRAREMENLRILADERLGDGGGW
jgi:hypothetical protein